MNHIELLFRKRIMHLFKLVHIYVLDMDLMMNIFNQNF